MTATVSSWLTARRWLTLAILGLGLHAFCAMASDKPYDDAADADQVLAHALVQANAQHKSVLLVFGANWCPDCRILDTILHSSDASALTDQYVLVKLSVGSFDRNLDIAKRFDVPLSKGIPAIVVLDGAGHSRFATRGGELADARSMGNKAVVDFVGQALAHRDAGL